MLKLTLSFLLFFSFYSEVRAENRFGEDWVVEETGPGRIQLKHSRLQIFAVITKSPTDYSIDNYLKGPDVSTNRYKGVTYGHHSFESALENKVGLFFERMWVEEKSLWQIALVTLEKRNFQSAAMHFEMNHIMSKLLKPRSGLSFIEEKPSPKGPAAALVPLRVSALEKLYLFLRNSPITG